MPGPEIEYRVLKPPTQRNVQQQLLSGASHTHIARAVLTSYTPALSELGICISRRTWCLRSCLHLGVPRATHRHSYTAVFGLPPVFCVLCLWLSASLCVNAHVNVTSQSPRDLKLSSCLSDHGSRFSGRCPRPATRAVVSLRLSGRSLHFAVTSREQRTHDQNIASAALDASSRVYRGTRELYSSCSPLRLRLRLDSSGNSNPLRYAA